MIPGQNKDNYIQPLRTLKTKLKFRIPPGIDFFRMFLFFVVISLLNSCAPRPTNIDPPIEQPEQFSISGTDVISDRWWRSFNDTTLNRIVDSALEENLLLAADWQEFMAALASVRRESSALWPQLAATAGTEIRRPESDFSEGQDIMTGISASYELDLWGRIRAGVQAEEYRARATYFDYRSAAMTISAETSITWYESLTARKQLALVREQVETNQDIVRLIRARFASGQVRAVDILRQEQLLESTREQLIFYETTIALLENELSVLLGQPPQNELDLPEALLPDLPPLPDTGLPLELVRRRPDVQQAYLLVLAADRELAAAIRSRYPVISIDLAGQFSSANYNTLFQNWAYSLAGNLVAPLIYGGRISAEIDRAEAVKQQLLYQYGQTVLVAFREVEDALIREINQIERIRILERQLDLSQKTSEQLKMEFLNGISNYLDVLLSLEQEQQLQRDLLEARQNLLEIRIGLYRSLAGGFETERETEFPAADNEFEN